MKKSRKRAGSVGVLLAAAVAVTGLVVTSVGSAAESQAIRVAVVTDIGGLNDKGFNFLSSVGLNKAKKDYRVEGRVFITKTAADRLHRALREDERIALFGDYDVDGTTGTAILAKFCRLVGRDPLIKVPHRMTDGYGLNAAAVAEFAAAGAKVAPQTPVEISPLYGYDAETVAARTRPGTAIDKPTYLKGER